MKHFLLGMIVCALICLTQTTSIAQAPVPIFEDEEFVTANGSPITLSLGHASPCVVDWDGDGIKDLLVGQYTSGKIRFYKNTGTNSAPVLTNYSFLQADGSDISLPSG